MGTYIVAHDEAVEELQPAHQYQERHEDVDELDSLRGGFEVVVPQVHQYSLCRLGV